MGKSIKNFSLALATLVVTPILWHKPILLSSVLLALGIAMILVEANKIAIKIYFIGFILGTSAEIIAMSTNAWNYTEPHILGIPVWLPFIWGNTALFINRANQKIRKSEK